MMGDKQDIASWLRDVSSCGCIEPERFDEAASLIERLRREVEELRKAIKPFAVNTSGDDGAPFTCYFSNGQLRRAYQSLAKEARHD